ncbi:MAG: nicotinamide-nucleotide amidohydrolase family protein, partial [Thermodesulfobacteriota bacterium]
SIPDLSLRLQPRANKSPELQQAWDWLQQELGLDIYSTQGRSLPVVLGDLLQKKGLTLALAESCTGGLIANLLTDISGSSSYFLLSAVTYSNQSKINVLGVRPKTLEEFGAVHPETAKEMARGACLVSGADYSLATSGIAGPTGGSPEKPVGTVCLGLAGPKTIRASTLQSGILDRGRNKSFFALAALDLLRRELAWI